MPQGIQGAPRYPTLRHEARKQGQVTEQGDTRCGRRKLTSRVKIEEYPAGGSRAIPGPASVRCCILGQRRIVNDVVGMTDAQQSKEVQQAKWLSPV